MKPGMLLLLLSLVFGLAPRQARGVEVSGFIRSVDGKAKRTRAGGSAKRARVGERVASGDELATGPNGAVELFLGKNGFTLLLHSDTRLKIAVLGQENNGVETVNKTTLEVSRGAVQGFVVRNSSNSTYLVRVPGAEIAIAPGTVTQYLADSRGNLEVYSGSAEYRLGTNSWRVLADERFSRETKTIAKIGRPPVVDLSFIGSIICTFPRDFFRGSGFNEAFSPIEAVAEKRKF